MLKELFKKIGAYFKTLTAFACPFNVPSVFGSDPHGDFLNTLKEHLCVGWQDWVNASRLIIAACTYKSHTQQHKLFYKELSPSTHIKGLF
jgi:hypothetical protein